MRLVLNLSAAGLLLLGLFGVFQVGYSFRPFNNAADDIVGKAESTFQARNQFEYYEIIRITEDNEVEKGGMLLIYEYEDEGVKGLWRITESSPDMPAATLLCLQPANGPASLFLYEKESSTAGRIEGIGKQRTLSNTDWHLEDIYDNDKEAGRTFSREGNAVVQGEYVFKIRSRYTDPIMRRNSAYGEGTAYFTVDTKRFLRLELFDKSNQLMKTIYPDNPINLGNAEEPRYRPRFIELIHHRQGTRTLLLLKKAVYNIEHAEDFFTPEHAAKWDASQDEAILARLKPLSEY